MSRIQQRHGRRMGEHLFNRWIAGGLFNGDIEKAGGSTANERSLICDMLTSRLAVAFLKGEVACDAGLRAMGNLIVVSNTHLSPFCWAVFEAFAAGIYGADEISIYLDPLLTFTIPQIKQALVRHENGREAGTRASG
ncbi:hypothetical protein [Burkholderia cenocepacia]|uniref:hypothetical protein n=1 Tax=Burkholderia cenocepacia TaxID=95486 RepID=UPI000AC03E9B|nr:hypothetical protein [Burkholderia cenocepacia]MDF0503963.1 hypothetical protein [Burkholderia cenocepacia]